MEKAVGVNRRFIPIIWQELFRYAGYRHTDYRYQYEHSGSSFKYLNLYTDIRIGTIISTILIENRNVIVEDKSRLAGCRKCDQYRECKMSSFVGVPIRVDNQAVGALALILTRHRAKFLFESLDSTVSFLENFSSLFPGKIENETRTIRLENRLKRLRPIIDKMFEAVIYTDYFGNIIHVNKRFCDVIHADKDMLEANMKETFSVSTDRGLF